MKRNRYREEGDRCRDARNWPQAAKAYTRHLHDVPNDAAIWVQLGHAVKEQRRFAAAEAHYRRAAAMMPADADVHLQLGHVLKLQDRPAEALRAYQRSHSLHPGSDAMREIDRLLPSMEDVDAPVLRDEGLFFSIDDLFRYLHVHPSMSGIQRVQAGLASCGISDHANPVQFITNDPRAGSSPDSYLRIDPDVLSSIIYYVSSEHVDHPRLKAMLANAEVVAERVRLGSGCTLVLLGAFWGQGNTKERFLATRQAGARLGAYIYDLIPVTHPQYCEPALVDEFTTSLREFVGIADFFLTASKYTRSTLSRFIRSTGLPAKPIRAAPLASTGLAPSPGLWPPALRQVQNRRYVAYVSTLEARKNHLYVVRAWQKLILDGVAVPDLVFVGRRGWRIEALTELLSATNNLGGCVHVVHDLSDAETNAVYQDALFTVFTSFVEGWGLPVGESLAQHVPCVASSTSSIPEVGGDLVNYVDPDNLDEGVAILKRLIEDDVYRTIRKNSIASSFVRRDWQDVYADLLQQVETCASRNTLQN